jgi:uncharacterized protein (DUF427 family)
VQAIWKGAVIAQSDNTKVVEGNHYFPADSVAKEHLEPSDHTSHCFWKGKANYYNVVVDGQVNRDAAWYYADPSPQAEQIRDHVAFWRGVEVRE